MRPERGLALAAVLVAGMATGACTKRTDDAIDKSLIRVSMGANMRTDTVENVPGKASFVLVDAENTASEGGYVALRGSLVDATGAVVGRLRPEELYMPAGSSRTFVLLDADELPRPTATGAKVEVGSAIRLKRGNTIKITDETIHPDHDRVVAAANVTNSATKSAKVIVLASFHDANGKPLTRPFDVISIGAGATRAVRFVGPAGSTKGAVYLGQVTY